MKPAPAVEPGDMPGSPAGRALLRAVPGGRLPVPSGPTLSRVFSPVTKPAKKLRFIKPKLRPPDFAMILTGLGGGGAGEVVPRGTHVRETGGWAGQTLREIGLKKHRGENSALLNQRTPARDWPGHCRAGADQRRGSEPPMCAPPGTPFARGGQQGGGGADLCVRSAGIGSEENCSMGSSKT